MAQCTVLLCEVAGTVTEEKRSVLRLSVTGNEPSPRVTAGCSERRGFRPREKLMQTNRIKKTHHVLREQDSSVW